MKIPSLYSVKGALIKPQNRYDLLEEEQNVFDIVRATKRKHRKCVADYDSISEKFWCGNARNTAEAVFNFCKKHIPYKAETKGEQTVKTPGKILDDAGVGDRNDCKHYALFCVGVLDSLKRKGYPVEVIYRFASDVENERYPKHVFAVLRTKEGDIWCDPVLDRFNQYHKYYFFLDKKPPKMALYDVSGVNGGPGTNTGDYVCGMFGYSDNGYVGKVNKKRKGLHLKIKPGKIRLDFKKFGLAGPRNAFLLLLKADVFNIAVRLFEYGQTQAGINKLKSIWRKAGGNWKNFTRDINQGYRFRKHHVPANMHNLSGLDEGGYVGIVAATGAAATLAAALPIIAMFKDIFKELGINMTQIKHTADGGIKELSLSHNVSDDGTHGDDSETEVTHLADGTNLLHIKSHKGNKLETDTPEAEAAAPAEMQSFPIPGGMSVPIMHPGDVDRSGESHKEKINEEVEDKEAKQEIPFAETAPAKAVNVVTDWGTKAGHWIENNKGIVIASLVGVTLIGVARSGIFHTKGRR